MTAQLSLERLEALANLQSLECMVLPASPAESAEMARMLLAGMDSEPVAVPDGYEIIAEAWRLMDGQNPATAEWHSAASRYLNAHSRAAMLNAGPVTAATEPDGWKLVPVEPTVEMREAFHKANEEAESGHCSVWSPDHQWSEMLAAYPAAPEQEV
jgi:hypothetical protein